MLETAIPARLDRLPWSPWHWRVVIALGVSWLLDGLEVTVVGSLGPALERPDTLALSAAQIGWAASAYIGGEYAAINSAIDELIPARVRGTVDLAINGSFWVGAAMGAGLSIVVLQPALIDPAYGWRLAFLLGGVLGFAILLVRRHVPESPRWLIRHGRAEEAERIVAQIEKAVGGTLPPVDEKLAMRALPSPGWLDIARLMLTRYRRRALLGLSLMASQALFYNAIFFTYALVLGRLFDSVGRRRMIALTYAVAGLGLIAAGKGFASGALDAAQLSLCWSAIFFVASAAASSAYLTVSEVFPVEMRAISISLFYAAGTALGGFAGPPLYGAIIESGSRQALFGAYSFAGLLMCAAGAVALWIGVDAERKPLEAVCAPLGCDVDPLSRGSRA